MSKHTGRAGKRYFYALGQSHEERGIRITQELLRSLIGCNCSAYYWQGRMDQMGGREPSGIPNTNTPASPAKDLT